MKFGYARVSSDGQSIDAQPRCAKLKAAVARQVFRDVASGVVVSLMCRENRPRHRAQLQRQPQHNFEAVAMTLLRDLMFADLKRGLAIARDGHEVVPAWRILAPDGDFLILTQFDPDKPEQRERAFALVPRFMAWKCATGFVLTAETWLGPERTRSGEEAVLTIAYPIMSTWR